MQTGIKNVTITSNRIEIKQYKNLWEAVVDFFENEYVQKVEEEGHEREASLEDEKFVQIIANGLRHDGERFSSSLPLRNRDLIPPDSKAQAMSRIVWQLKRMKADEKYHSEYTAFMNKIIDKGYAELRKNDPALATTAARWYLPHHRVKHPVKGKLRVVLDCSSKAGGVSLNDQLLQGPNFMNSLVGVLMRFRRHEVATSKVCFIRSKSTNPIVLTLDSSGGRRGIGTYLYMSM